MTVTKMRIPGRPSLGLVHTPRGKRTLGDPASLPRHRGRSKASVLLLALARTYAILAGMAILSSPRGRGFDRARAHFLRVRWARHFLGRVPDAQQNHVRDPPLPRRHSRRSSGSRAERCRVTSVRGRPAGVSAWTQHPRSPRYGRVARGRLENQIGITEYDVLVSHCQAEIYRRHANQPPQQPRTRTAKHRG